MNVKSDERLGIRAMLEATLQRCQGQVVALEEVTKQVPASNVSEEALRVIIKEMADFSILNGKLYPEGRARLALHPLGGMQCPITRIMILDPACSPFAVFYGKHRQPASDRLMQTL